MSTNKKMRAESLTFDFSAFRGNDFYTQKKYKTGEVAIDLPDNMRFSFTPTTKERAIAKEIFIRCGKKKILDMQMCSNGNAEFSLKSLFDIRDTLVDMEVKVNLDSPLYLLIEYALSGISQFMGYTENFPKENQWDYIEALEILRPHLALVLKEISKVAGVKEKHEFRFNSKRSPGKLPGFFRLAKKYNDNKKIETLFKALTDKGIIKGEIGDFKELFNGGSAGKLKWIGSNIKIIYFMVLLYVLTLEEPESFKRVGNNLDPKTFDDIKQRFQITGGRVAIKGSAQMLSESKRTIISYEAIGKGAMHTYRREITDIVKTAFDIKELIPPKS
ncbi:MAG: hypothetical protein ACLQQ4_01695 [Bacteroidia bacterium]